MIDLHSHILPGIDDGASSMAVSIDMARIAVADGITHMACTPHIVPGLYENELKSIEPAMDALSSRLAEMEIPLNLVIGADLHIAPNLRDRLDRKEVPTLAGSRYFLFEPPHNVLPPGLEHFAKGFFAAGYVPVLTHPERLTWIEQRYETICALCRAGMLIQLTAGSITGAFGSRARYWSERMLEEGRVDIIASDAHDTKRRPPILSKARKRIAELLGEEEADAMTQGRPLEILNDRSLAKAAAKSF